MPVLAVIAFFSLFFVVSTGPIFLGRELGALEFFSYALSLSAALSSIFFLVLYFATRKGMPFLIVSACIFLLSGLFGFVASTETNSANQELVEKQRIQMKVDLFRLDPFAYAKDRGREGDK